MALPILDGNQSATTLSTILSSGQHITAHTVVSLGTQAITDIVNATSANLTNTQLRASAVTVGGTVTVGNFPSSQAVTFGAVTGSVSVLNFPASQAVTFSAVSISNFPSTQPVSIASVTIGSLPALVAGTAQIGSVTASISNSVTIASLPAISGTVTANLSESITEPIDSTNATQAIAVHIKDADGNNWGAENIFPVVASGTVTANTFALQGTAVTTSNFTSTTASTVLAGYNATREVLTIFNEGAGNLHICVGATCTTIAYQVRLSAGDYYEVPSHQTTITHSAVFAAAGTARVTEVS